MSSTNKFRLQRSDPFLILNLFDVARFHIYLSCSGLLIQKGTFIYQSRNFLKCNGLYLTDNCMNGMKYQSTVCYISFLVFCLVYTTSCFTCKCKIENKKTRPVLHRVTL